MKRKATLLTHDERENASTHEIEVRRSHLALAIKASRHSLARSCSEEVSKEVFDAPLIARRGGRIMVTNERFNRYLEASNRCGVDIYYALQTYGVVPIFFRHAEGVGIGPNELVPVVPPPKSFRLFTWLDAGVQRFRIRWLASDTPVDDVIVFSGFDTNPDIDGTLTSVMAVIVPDLDFVDQLREYMLDAEDVRSKPPVLLRFDTKADAALQETFKGESFFGGGIDAAASAEEYREKIDARQALQRRRLEHEWQTLHGNRVRARDVFVKNAGERRKRSAAEMYLDENKIPAGPLPREYLDVAHESTTYHLPASPDAYIQCAEQLTRKVRGAFGLPQVETARVRTQAEESHESLHKTVKKYRIIISRILTQIYNHLQGSDELAQELRSLARTRRTPANEPFDALVSESDIESTAAATRIEIGFQPTLRASTATLDFGRNRGVLSWELYCRLFASRIGLDMHDIEIPAKDPLSQADRKQLVLGSSEKKDADDAESVL